MGKGKKVKCLNCKDTLQSKHRHDWVSCSCYKETHELVANITNEIVKKGSEVPTDHSFSKVVQISEHELKFILGSYLVRGFFIDGGGDYFRCGGNLADLSPIKRSNE